MTASHDHLKFRVKGKLIPFVLVFGVLSLVTTGCQNRVATIIRNQGTDIWYSSVAGNCETVQIGSTGNGSLGSMARNNSGGIYGISGDTLVRVNQTTGQTSTVVAITGLDVASVRAMTFDNNDNLFAVTKDPADWQKPNKLYRINLSTGAATFIGEMRFLGIQAMETGPNGEIYVWDSGGHAHWSLGLGTVNPQTGEVTDVNTSDNYDSGTNVKPNLQALVLMSKMYGLGNGNIYEIDLNTGAATMKCFGVIGGDGFGAEYVYVEWPE
jgi:hypothetical protein